MSEMYERIYELCVQRGIKPGRICTDTGLSRGMMTDLKMGRTKTLSTKNTKVVAEYLGVSADDLMGTEIEKPAQPEVTMDEFDYALYRATRRLSDEDKAELIKGAQRMDEVQELREKRKD